MTSPVPKCLWVIGFVSIPALKFSNKGGAMHNKYKSHMERGGDPLPPGKGY